MMELQEAFDLIDEIQNIDDVLCEYWPEFSEALSIAKRCIGKEMAKKPAIRYENMGFGISPNETFKIKGCPCCKEDIDEETTYCQNCGQHLDWTREGDKRMMPTIVSAIEKLKYLIGGESNQFPPDYVLEIDVAISALEKQVQKKPIWTRQGFFKKCPTCSAYVDGVYNRKYCGNCGQKLDRKGETT